MSSPVTPTDAAATVPNPSGSLCSTFQNALMKLPTDWAAFIAWMLDSSGNFSDAFKTMLSAAVMPVGSIIPSALSTVPTGFLLCNGQAVSRTTYATLYAAIGVAFGTGDGSTTFNVPDMRDRYPRGVGSATSLGDKTADAYSPEVTLTEGQIPHHAHYFGLPAGLTVASEEGRIGGASVAWADSTATTGAGRTRDYGPGTPASQDPVVSPEPKNIVVNFYIKY